MLRCGIDMIENQRIEDGIARLGDRFLNRFFTEAELELCQGKAYRLAARIAAKEAVAKALGTGIGDVSWKEIEILSDERRRPVLILHGAAVELSNQLGLSQWDISLTHTETYASAVAVAL